jgi:hypothetical protein
MAVIATTTGQYIWPDIATAERSDLFYTSLHSERPAESRNGMTTSYGEAEEAVALPSAAREISSRGPSETSQISRARPLSCNFLDFPISIIGPVQYFKQRRHGRGAEPLSV